VRDATPVVALSIGDPCGIGPEIALRLLAEGSLPARVLLLCDARALERDRALVPGAPAVPRAASAEAFRASGAPFALDPVADEAGRARCPGGLPPLGRPDARAGAACHDWVLRGADLALSGAVDALVTGPIHKEAWGLAGVEEPGHTETLARRAGARRVLMLMVGGGLRVALSTIHVPLSSVPRLVTAEGVRDDLVLLDRELRERFGVARPRIAVCGVNPHAGEGGRFGPEDAAAVAPAVAAARAGGVLAEGPLPADAAIPRAASGAFDAVLAMYHDQGLVAVKTVAPRGAVNVTLGLPFVRTSVDHGTAFDRAGAGTATASSLRAAVELAAEIRRARRAVVPPT
jgi:4-hydroxythreonine-4-phosphate dehydrogenase